MKWPSLLVCLLFSAAPCVAFADPCEGRLPSQPGAVFTGEARYVGDGDSLCVGQTPNPDEWIEVRLADFDAPELREPEGRRSRDFLVRVASGRQIRCTATRGRGRRVISHDRVIAVCRLNGRSLGDILQQNGAPTGGN